MTDNTLNFKEFEYLFSLSDAEYERHAPDWLRRVQKPVDDDETTRTINPQDLIVQLQTFTKSNSRLEQVLLNNGLSVPQDIEYNVAKAKISEINNRIPHVVDHTEYQQLCQELEKYTSAMLASEEYQLELQQQERAWEQANYNDNVRALHAVRKHMPVNVRLLSEQSLAEDEGLPTEIARKFIRTNVLQLIRRNPNDIEKMHPSLLEGLKTTGLTLTERRALYEHLKVLQKPWQAQAKDPMTQRKLVWYNNLKTKFQEGLSLWNQHKEQYGAPSGSSSSSSISSTHKCSAIGNQCPFKADAVIDYYRNDYGYPQNDVYEATQQVVRSTTPVQSRSNTPVRSSTPSRSTTPRRTIEYPSTPKRNKAKMLGEMTTKQPSAISPAVSAKGQANRGLLTEILNTKPKTTTTTTSSSNSRSSTTPSRQQLPHRGIIQPTRSRKNLLIDIAHKSEDTTAGAASGSAAALKKKPMGGLLAGLAGASLKKTGGPKIKKSLIKEVPAGTKPTTTTTTTTSSNNNSNSSSSPNQPATKPKKKRMKKFKTITKEMMVDDVVEETLYLDKKEAQMLDLKNHYKNDPNQLEQAKLRIESMETLMDIMQMSLDQWIDWKLLDKDEICTEQEKDKQVASWKSLLQQMEGVIKSMQSKNGDDGGNTSVIECQLVQDLHKLSSILFHFLLERGKALKRKDKDIRKLIPDLNRMLTTLQSKSTKQLRKLGSTTTSKTITSSSRTIKSVEEIMEDKKNNMTSAQRSAMRKVALEKHYGKSKADRAMRSCDGLDGTIDRIDTYFLANWVEEMVLSGSTETKNMSDADKQKIMNKYRMAVDELESFVTTLIKYAYNVERSKIECELAEDLVKISNIMFSFILSRMKKLEYKDKVLKKLMKSCDENINAIHDKNLQTLKELGVVAQPTREIKTVKQYIKSILNPPKSSKAEKDKKIKVIVKKTVKKKIQVEEEVTDSDVSESEEEPEHISITPVTPPKPEKEIIIADKVGRDQLKWQLMKQVQEASKMKKKLEKAITNAGLTIPDEKIGYREAEAKIAEISRMMQEVGFQHRDYFTLEQQMEKYQSALMASEEYQRETKRRENEWESKVLSANQKALRQLRKHMPVGIRNMSEAALTRKAAPNGKKLPSAIAKKIKRSNCLQLIRLNPNYIEQMHFANLEGMSLSGLTLTENRALYEHLREVGNKWEKQKSDKNIERKYLWFVNLRNKLKQLVEKYEKHAAEYGDAGRHRCTWSTNQCPVKAEQELDYSGDYGYSPEAIYDEMLVAKEDMAKYTRKNDNY